MSDAMGLPVKVPLEEHHVFGDVHSLNGQPGSFVERKKDISSLDKRHVNLSRWIGKVEVPNLRQPLKMRWAMEL